MSNLELQKINQKLEYLMTHNKNYTKKQYFLIDDIFTIIYTEIKRREMMKK